jgi:hypothetical protein
VDRTHGVDVQWGVEYRSNSSTAVDYNDLCYATMERTRRGLTGITVRLLGKLGICTDQLFRRHWLPRTFWISLGAGG